MHFAPFFYFEFRSDSADTADTDQVGPIWAALALISAASARVGPIREQPRGTTWHGRAVCGVPPALPRPAASDASALAWEPRPCIPNKAYRNEPCYTQSLLFIDTQLILAQRVGMQSHHSFDLLTLADR